MSWKVEFVCGEKKVPFREKERSSEERGGGKKKKRPRCLMRATSSLVPKVLLWGKVIIKTTSRTIIIIIIRKRSSLNLKLIFTPFTCPPPTINNLETPLIITPFEMIINSSNFTTKTCLNFITKKSPELSSDINIILFYFTRFVSFSLGPPPPPLNISFRKN